jgi:hypothetical protein
MNNTIEKQYKTSKETCQATIDNIGGVCSGCGGKLSPIETVDNSGDPTFWSHCPECEVFDWGTSKEIFEIAKHMVTEQHYVHYGPKIIPKDETESGRKDWLSRQIRGTVYMVRQVLATQAIIKQQPAQKTTEE